MRVDYVYMLLVLLIPLLPAYVLFRSLPSSAKIHGPLKGLDIKLGGAFGGYIVAVLVAWQIASSLLEPTWSDNWNLVAQVKFDDASASHPPLSEVVISLRPPSPSIDRDGMTQMRVAIPRVQNGAIELPRMIVEYTGYETVNVPLDPDSKNIPAYGGQDYNVQFLPKEHRIIIGKPIVLTKAAP